jgi:hypothetical protein
MSGSCPRCAARLFQQQHLQSGQCQHLGGNAAAGAAADDGDVGLHRLRRVSLAASMTFQPEAMPSV